MTPKRGKAKAYELDPVSLDAHWSSGAVLKIPAWLDRRSWVALKKCVDLWEPKAVSLTTTVIPYRELPAVKSRGRKKS